MDASLIAFCAVVSMGYAIQTVAGFGSMLFCVTVGAQLVGVQEVLNLAVPVSVLQTGYILVKDHRHIRWRLLLTRVLPLLGLGMALPLILMHRGQADSLRPVFGAMVLVLALRELWLSRRAKADVERAPLGPVAFALTTTGAGVVHGIFATGGPLLVYGMGRLKLDKSAFRASLSLVWLLLNLVLIVTFVVAGQYGDRELTALPWVVAGLPVGIVVGELVHHRVDERRFRNLIWALLAVAAVPLILR